MLSSATSSETEDTATTLSAVSLLVSSNAGRDLERHPLQKRRLPAVETPSVPEGEEWEVSEYCRRRRGFEARRHQERQFEEVDR